MAKKKEQAQATAQIPTSLGTGLPVPFTLEMFQKDVLILFVQQLRTIAWMTDEKTGWKITGKPLEKYDTYTLSDMLYNPDRKVEDIDLSYAEIRATPFAECLEDMYQYAYFGLIDESGEQMDYETIYTWMAAILSDLHSSRMLDEWESYGGEGSDSASRCLRVCELANARRVLEGHENFFFFTHIKGEEPTALNGLTVRQLALLSGMEEMSIRAAANPKRANPLPTFSEDGRTLIAIGVAKAWLQEKGRYVPITRRFGQGDIDLRKHKFATTEDLRCALGARQEFVVRRDQREEELNAQLANIGVKVSQARPSASRVLGLSKPQLLDASLMEALANILDLPQHLLVLRAKEAVANEELAAIERELRTLTAS